jgi:hypothetical protein
MHRFIPAMTSLAGTRIAEIRVKHHARRYGESKYGLSRIYKVLMDLLTIKTILSFFSRPLVIFAVVAGVSALIGIMTFIAGVILYSNNHSIVLFSVGLLYTTLGIVLLLWGVLGELVYRVGDLKLEHFSQIKRSIQKKPQV